MPVEEKCKGLYSLPRDAGNLCNVYAHLSKSQKDFQQILFIATTCFVFPLIMFMHTILRMINEQ